LEKQNLDSLDRDSFWADTPFSELGLPDLHLYTVRYGGSKEQE
jgi:hypothetical protein